MYNACLPALKAPGWTAPKPGPPRYYHQRAVLPVSLVLDYVFTAALPSARANRTRAGCPCTHHHHHRIPGPKTPLSGNRNIRHPQKR
ncbi:hypothetical protein BD779DRAFT_1577049 [Infundibulicybe gibba]|nr:hypothetical protein BD779DRAFT_1577049 [Infundibulicybe gibba]